MMATSTAASANSAASINPVGPPPTITTAWSFIAALRSPVSPSFAVSIDSTSEALAATPRCWVTLGSAGGSRRRLQALVDGGQTTGVDRIDERAVVAVVLLGVGQTESGERDVGLVAR